MRKACAAGWHLCCAATVTEWRTEDIIRMGKGSVLAPSTRGRTTFPRVFDEALCVVSLEAGDRVAGDCRDAYGRQACGMHAFQGSAFDDGSMLSLCAACMEADVKMAAGFKDAGGLPACVEHALILAV